MSSCGSVIWYQNYSVRTRLSAKLPITIQYTVSEKLETAIKILKQTNRQTKQTRGLLTKGVSF